MQIKISRRIKRTKPSYTQDCKTRRTFCVGVAIERARFSIGKPAATKEMTKKTGVKTTPVRLAHALSQSGPQTLLDIKKNCCFEADGRGDKVATPLTMVSVTWGEYQNNREGHGYYIRVGQTALWLLSFPPFLSPHQAGCSLTVLLSGWRPLEKTNLT